MNITFFYINKCYQMSLSRVKVVLDITKVTKYHQISLNVIKYPQTSLYTSIFTKNHNLLQNITKLYPYRFLKN